MTRAEAIEYLQPIADSASLNHYRTALNLAINALRADKSPEITFEQRSTEKCEHIVGLYCKSYDSHLVTLPDLKWHIRDMKEFNEMCRMYGYDELVSEEYTLKDYADKRKSSNLTRFDYCPLCGEKINWKEIGRDKQ